MPARSLASLTLSFGLVYVPVRLYSAEPGGGQVNDFVEALRASLARKPSRAGPSPSRPGKTAEIIPAGVLKDRKPVRRGMRTQEPASVPAKAAARK